MRRLLTGRSFPLALAVAGTLAYLHAAFVPTFVDARLRTIVTYPGGRTYPLAWLVPPASVGVFFSTLVIALYVPARLRASLVCIPLLLASALSNVFILRAELPHIGLAVTTAVWLSILGLWTWIHDSHLDPESDLKSVLEADEALEFLKEEANFYRTLAFGLLGGSLALVVTAAAAVHTGSKELVGNSFGVLQAGAAQPSTAQIANARSDLFLYDQVNYTGVALFWLALLFGPVLEAFRAWRITADLFLQLKKPHPNSLPRAGDVTGTPSPPLSLSKGVKRGITPQHPPPAPPPAG